MLIFIKILVLVYLLLTFPIIGEEALPKCKIEANNIISQNYCFGILNIGEEFTYTGEFHKGQLNGKGTFIWLKKKTYNDYNGEFKDDKMHGKGKLRWINGDVYIGNFVGGKQQGYG